MHDELLKAAPNGKHEKRKLYIQKRLAKKAKRDRIYCVC